MLRRTLALLASTTAFSMTSVALADTYGGWTYSPPAGYALEKWSDHVQWTKVGPQSFCAVDIFQMRQLESSLAVEAAYEWHDVVTTTFSPKVTRRATMKTAAGADVTATTATLTAGDGTPYAGTHYVVTPPGMIGSVLLTSTSHAALRACAREVAPFIRSLDIDWDSPRYTHTDPEAREENPQGRWTLAGPTSREYTFAPDGTYRFRSETRDGRRMVEERGTYTVLGNQLTLTPTKSLATTFRGGRTSRTNLPLDQTTYLWLKRYNFETNAWRIVLVPRKPTTRDGALPDVGYSYTGDATWNPDATVPSI